MKFKTIKAIGLTALFLVLSDTAFAQQYEPLLLLSKSEAKNISQHLGDYKILEKSFSKVKKGADKALESKIEVPIPVDNGGGYTHEKHKKNYRELYYAGLTFQVTGEKKYAKFVEEMLGICEDLSRFAIASKEKSRAKFRKIILARFERLRLVSPRNPSL